MSWWQRLIGGKDAELIRELGGRDNFLAESAAHTLGRVGDKRAVIPLIKALRSGRTRQIRSNAAGALGKLHDRRAIQPLQQAVLDPEEHVWSQAAAALAVFLEFFTEAVDELARGSEEQRLIVERVLQRTSDPRAAEPIVRLMQDQRVDAAIRAEAAFALGGIGDSRAVESLIVLLRDEGVGEAIHAAAASALGATGEKRAVEPLLEALSRLTGEARVWVAGALGRLRDGRATQPLVELLSDPDWHVRHAVVAALGEIADPRTVEALAVGLEDENSNVRSATEEALSRVVAPNELAALRKERQARLWRKLIRAELGRFLRSDQTRQFEAANGTWWTEDDLALVLARARLEGEAGTEVFRRTMGEILEEMMRSGALRRDARGFRAPD